MAERGRPRKILTKEDILRAQANTLSNRAAARYLHVSYYHYRDYARSFFDEETGKTLFDLHTNQSGKGVPKFGMHVKSRPTLDDIIEGRVPIEHFTAKKIKEMMLYEGLLRHECYVCGFNQKRIVDNRVPVILYHKDGNRKNFRLENLELMCYNCSFLYAASPITDEQVNVMEDFVDSHRIKEPYWELDEHHIAHLRSLGLYYEEDSKDDDEDLPGAGGTDYIAFL